MIYKSLDIKHNSTAVLSVSGFAEANCGINNNCKNVYFVRAIGVNNSLINDIKNMDISLGRNMCAGSSAYIRINALPKLLSADDTNYYLKCYSQWISNGKQLMSVKAVNNNFMKQLLSKACNEALNVFQKGKLSVSSSIEKNFIVKMMFWFDSIMGNLLYNKDESFFVKIVAENIIKKQEYLFFYMLTLMGINVLLIQSKSDINSESDQLNLSKKFVLGGFGNINIPVYIPNSINTCSGSDNGSVNVRNVSSVKSSYAPKMVQNNSSGNIKVTIPQRPKKIKDSQSLTLGVSGQATKAAANTAQNAQIYNSSQNLNTVIREERSFEDLAQLAKSVVMIAIHDNHGEIIGSGSGIMIGREGYILTNNHVASGGRFYSVRIEDDNRIYETDDVIKYNNVLDLAVIRIERQLTPIPVYNSSKKLVRGQKVVAIGSPLGLFNSVSDGIISGFRTVDNVDMIQFTAPISSGSSGGAVLNMYGEVIGISTAGIDAGQNINLAVGYTYINTFINGFI